MKYILILFFVIFVSSVNAAVEYDEKPIYGKESIDTVVLDIKNFLPDGWEIQNDDTTIILYRKKPVRMLSPVSLPPLEDKELWEQFSWESNYIITIRFASIMSFESYAKLKTLRASAIEERAKLEGVKKGSKMYWSLRNSISKAFLLPEYQGKRYSIYLNFTGEDYCLIRPEDPKIVRESVIQIIEKSFSSYEQKEEQQIGTTTRNSAKHRFK